MCTVTFIKTAKSCIITSNRDEQYTRPVSYQPQTAMLGNKKVLCPKDAKAGGTWFAVDEQGNAVVLLNGAFEKYTPDGLPHRSRGLMVLDLIGEKSPIEAAQTIDLNNIEPFTAVITTQDDCKELRWDGQQKHLKQLDLNQKYLWSSVTLYDPTMRKMRESWFKKFIKINPNPTPELMMRFHRFSQSENKEFGLVIDRPNTVKTFSITQAVITPNEITMSHYDLKNHEQYKETL
jgi:uncharacterized protein with NRDE domain